MGCSEFSVVLCGTQACRANGAYPYVCQPYSLQRLFQRMHSLPIGRRAGLSAGPTTQRVPQRPVPPKTKIHPPFEQSHCALSFQNYYDSFTIRIPLCTSLPHFEFEHALTNRMACCPYGLCTPVSQIPLPYNTPYDMFVPPYDGCDSEQRTTERLTAFARSVQHVVCPHLLPTW